MPIEKTAHKTECFRRDLFAFPNARSAFKALLKSINFKKDEFVLLPAYIGWSPREGSGVFDPIKELNLSYGFYAMDTELNIDMASIKHELQSGNVKLVVLIHYFGYVDPNYQEVISLAKDNGAMILEDEAHALYTDFIGGRSGRLCDAAIFSLHKLLPFPNGGLLCLNDRHIDFGDIQSKSLLDYPFMKYDLYGIAKKRIENALMVLHLLEKYCDEIVPLRSQLNKGIVPQTIPVMVNRASRDLVYQKMNESGFGVVSLYHTLIDQIDRDRFPNAYNLSKRILNLPIHQDIEQNEVEKMIAKLIEVIRKC